MQLHQLQQENALGNSATATKLATARKITLSGAVTGNATFDGSGNITIATTQPVTKQTITKEDSDVKMIITARKSANIVSLHFSMTYKTTNVLLDFASAIPTAFRPKENIRMAGVEASQILIGTNGNVSGTYVENLGSNFVITYIID